MHSFSAVDISLVRESFRIASAAPETLATAFFRRLFELDRSLRRLFHGDMRQLGHAFVSTLDAFVGNLEHFDEFTPHMRSLGSRHAGYQVRSEHFAIGGIALIGTLGVQLGESFTPDMRAAWTRVLGAITDEVVAGMRHATPVAAPEAPVASTHAEPSRSTA